MSKTWLAFLGLTLCGATSVAAYPPAPANAAQVRVGGFVPSGGGELWESNEAIFTLDATDMADWALGFSFLQGVSNHADVAFNVDFYDGSALSDYRIDHPGSPILHDTRLSLVPVTVELRVLPGGRYRLGDRQGRSASPRPVLYLGAGLGASWWEYEESGEFLDGAEIFSGHFVDSGVAFEAHVLAGLEMPVSPFTSLLLEGRYSFADDELEDDFAGLGKIELGGASGFAGLSFRF
jgi:hypothetical protein